MDQSSLLFDDTKARTANLNREEGENENEIEHENERRTQNNTRAEISQRKRRPLCVGV